MPKPLTEVIVKLPDQTQHRLVLDPGDYLVGRHPDCPIRVDSPNVSQEHARLGIGVDDLRLEEPTAPAATPMARVE
ncbi:MAG: FHA domain-containing protein [Limisphaerales bacterium]